jgi:hypothetical protein
MKAMIAKVNHFHAIILSLNRNAQPQYYRGFADFPKKISKNFAKSA